MSRLSIAQSLNQLPSWEDMLTAVTALPAGEGVLWGETVEQGAEWEQVNVTDELLTKALIFITSSNKLEPFTTKAELMAAIYDELPNGWQTMMGEDGGYYDYRFAVEKPSDTGIRW